MKKAILLLFVILLITSFVSAEKYALTVKGEPRSSDGQIELIYEAGSIVDDVKSEGTIDHEKGSFEITNSFDSQKLIGGLMIDNSMNVYVSGNCFYHSYNIMRKGDSFEVSDAYDSDHKPIITTKKTTIDLEILKEDMSNQVMVDFDIPVSFKAEDMNGNVVAENSGFRKFTGMTNTFKLNTQYKLILTTENGKIIEKEINTGNYCESTRLLKRGSYFTEEHFSSNSFPPIGFLKNIWLSILGLRLIVILPLVLVPLFIIALIIFLVFRKKRSKNVVAQV